MCLSLIILLTGMTFGGFQATEFQNKLSTNVEIIELRTEHQKVFKLENGNYEYRIFSNPVHYFNGEEMVEIQYSNSSKIIKNTTNVFESDLKTAINVNQHLSNVFTYDNLITDINKSEEWFINDNSLYTQVNNEYLINSDEFYFFPINQSSTYNRNSFLLTSEYNPQVILDNNISYPITLVNESIISNNDNPIIKDKYITIGMSGSTESSILLAGCDKLQIWDQNNNLVRAKYVTIIEVDFPNINPAYIVSSKIGISKNSTTLIAERNPNVSLNKVTSNIDYEAFEGTTHFNETLIATGNGNEQNYIFDITNLAISSVSSDSKLLLTIEGSETGYASFYSTESTNLSSLYVSFEVTDNILGGTLYGDAPAYSENNSSSVNCFAYAILQDHWVTMNLTSSAYEDVYNKIKYIVELYGYEIRKLNSYNSDIFSDERRIAFRYDFVNLNCWHFVLQNSDGAWSGKVGSGNSGQYPITMNPECESMWDMYVGLQNKQTYYFALK